jgi:hypothetical protein
LLEAKDFESITGKGVVGTVNGTWKCKIDGAK